MKKIVSVLAILVIALFVGGYAFAHCGHCGISDGYACAKDKVAQLEPGKCPTCGGELAKGDVKEVKGADGTITYEPAPAQG